MNERIASKTEERSYIDDNGMIYVLVVAPLGQSVELLNVFGDDNLIQVQYSTLETPYSFDGKTTTLIFGENPYVLIKVNDPITEISFKNYSGVLDELVRLDML